MVAVYCAGRLAVSRVRGRDTELDTDGLHVLMGVAMAGMLEPGLSPVPGTVWRAVFAAAAAWFAWQAIRARRPAGQGARGAPTRRRTPSNAPPWSTCSCPQAPGRQAAGREWPCPA